jgi:transporter family protein
MTWQLYALLAAIAGGATAVLTKVGAAGVPPNTGVAIRTAVVFIFALSLVFMSGEGRAWPRLSTRAAVFLGLSAIATGVSWLAYFRALQLGPVSGVAPIDKLSLVFAIVLAAAWLGEPLSGRTIIGVTLMVAGALLTLRA